MHVHYQQHMAGVTSSVPYYMNMPCSAQMAG